MKILAALLLLSIAAFAQETAQSAFKRGVQMFFDAKPKESVAAFDELLKLNPEAKPELWQRGLSLYYAGDFKGGREQFETHQTYNTNDVENAAWHFLCVAKAESVEAARKVLIPIQGDTRIPMKQVHELFAGKATPEDVLKAAESGEGEVLRNHRCFAHLYLGLYFESIGENAKAKEHMVKAATDFKMDHYMGKVAQVHVKLRGW
jgi:lipoprotein NlpI